MKYLIFIFSALVLCSTDPVTAADISVDVGLFSSNTYHAYGNLSNSQSRNASAHVVFLDVIAVDSTGAELPFDSSETTNWDIVKASSSDGNLACTIGEQLTFSATLDTVVDGDASYVISDRDTLTSARYFAVRPVGTQGLLGNYTMDDSVAASIMGAAVTEEAILGRMQLALAYFSSVWSTPTVVEMDRGDFNKLDVE
jgi:hypothetical protein